MSTNSTKRVLINKKMSQFDELNISFLIPYLTLVLAILILLPVFIEIQKFSKKKMFGAFLILVFFLPVALKFLINIKICNFLLINLIYLTGFTCFTYFNNARNSKESYLYFITNPWQKGINSRAIMRSSNLFYQLALFLNKWNPYPYRVKNAPRLSFNYFFSLLASHVVYYPTPAVITYAWSFGALAGICLVIQMISGIFLAMFYIPHMDFAFRSIEFIMRKVGNGWLIRYIHSNGSSLFFITVYLHIIRGLYYGSYFKPRESLWCSGIILYLLMMATAYTGYILPWGQLSFWGGTVGTSMVTVFPVVGKFIAEWIWGQSRFGNPALKRIFSIHFVLPFLIAGMSLIHLTLLHRHGSTSPLGSDTGTNDVPFYPYFFSKDVLAFFCVFFFLVFSFLLPELFCRFGKSSSFFIH